MRIALLVPGPITAISGGYGYDRMIVAQLRAAGHAVDVIELEGRHPVSDGAALESARAAMAKVAPDAIPVIDGLGLPAFGTGLERRAVGLIHHPTSMEAGFSADDAAWLREVETRMFPALAGCIVTSPTTAETLAKDFGVAPERIVSVVPGTEAAPRSPGSAGRSGEML